MNGSKEAPRNGYLVEVGRSWYSLFLDFFCFLLFFHPLTHSTFLRCWVVMMNKISLYLHGVYFLVRIEAEEPGIHNPKGGEGGWQGIVLEQHHLVSLRGCQCSWRAKYHAGCFIFIISCNPDRTLW